VLSLSQVDFGYDVSDYENIESYDGTLADFDGLEKEAKKPQHSIIMDFVIPITLPINTSVCRFSIFTHLCERDWYIWRDGKRSRTASEQNWVFNIWRIDLDAGPQNRAILLPLFLYAQPADLNWRNPAVHDACSM